MNIERCTLKIEDLHLQMHIDYLLIGQGISGTWLSYYLQKEQKSFLVIDNNQAHSPSRLTAGMINPVSGRRHAAVWMANELIPFAWEAYTEIGKELGITAISRNDILDFFPTPQMRLSFQQRVEEKADHVTLPGEENKYRGLFHYEFGYGEIKPVYSAHLETLLPAWRKLLTDRGQLLEEEFDITQLQPATRTMGYKDLSARHIIFCDGNGSMANPYFKNLPFAPNKGEALILEIPELPAGRIYKKGMSLVPLATPGHWWIGSTYQWDFKDPLSTQEFYDKTEQLLNQWLKMPFRIVSRRAGVRPATLERRPFVGLHPGYPAIGILNGMGAKGCSLAPFFAKQLTDHLLHGKPIAPEADIRRFTRILQRPAEH